MTRRRVQVGDCDVTRRDEILARRVCLFVCLFTFFCLFSSFLASRAGSGLQIAGERTKNRRPGWMVGLLHILHRSVAWLRRPGRRHPMRRPTPTRPRYDRIRSGTIMGKASWT